MPHSPKPSDGDIGMKENSTVAQEIARFLTHQGVERVYGLPGGEVTHLIAALRNEGLE
ncbi:uncharacterized protein METZ01_LOCUS335526, partial [marine metagenome]